jgi:hypothetical protein
MTATLAEAVTAALEGTRATPAQQRATFLESQEDLRRIAALEPDADLRALAERQSPGDAPLIGTASTTDAYASLLWNGEWMERLGVPWRTRLVLLAQIAAGEPAPESDLGAALGAGETMRLLWPPAAAPHPVAELSYDTVAAAICAAMASGIPNGELTSLAELAAALMVVAPSQGHLAPHGLNAGHSLAAGWLAVQLHRCRVLAAPGTGAEVLSTREAP